MPEGTRGRRLWKYVGCILLACAAAVTSFAAPAPAQTLVGAGDIASCDNDYDTATARLLGRINGTIFTLGDNAYDRGTRAEFANCYHPTWGRYRNRTRPSAGNHEYYTAGARPYFDYFGRRAAHPRRGYYSYNKGSWHVVVLNSNCAEVGGCGLRSRQIRWLRRDLTRNRARCTVAYFHHPLFSSGRGTETNAVRAFWRVLYNRGADVILSGHAHSYERFAPQTPGGRRSPKKGIRQFVVGTGGEPALRPFGARAANSQVRNDETPGVLRLNLRRGGYTWKFVPIAGMKFTDSGRSRCH